MPVNRSVRLRPSQIVWLVAIVVVGLVVGFIVGPWWGVGAAAIVLLISEVIERVQRARS